MQAENNTDKGATGAGLVFLGVMLLPLLLGIGLMIANPTPTALAWGAFLSESWHYLAVLLVALAWAIGGYILPDLKPAVSGDFRLAWFFAGPPAMAFVAYIGGLWTISGAFQDFVQWIVNPAHPKERGYQMMMLLPFLLMIGMRVTYGFLDPTRKRNDSAA